jgi:conjugal transfer mating pair stabilization protein TraN
MQIKLFVFFLILSIMNYARAEDVCVETNRTCVEGAETRVVEGLSVYKSCWKYDIEYACQSQTNYLDYCTGIKSIAGCSLISTTCDKLNTNSICEEYSNIYKCHSSNSNNTLTIDYTHTIAQNNSNLKSCSEEEIQNNCAFVGNRCIDENCSETRKDYICVNSIFLDDCANYDVSKCTLEKEECVTSECVSKKYTYKCITDEDSKICENPTVSCLDGSCVDDEDDYDNSKEFIQAVSSLEGVNETATTFNAEDLKLLSGDGKKCGIKILSAKNCCNDSGWAGSMMDCDTEELQLAEMNKSKQCYYIGQYCGQKESLTGTCLETKKSYCCFSSKLARIINVAGRQQLNISFGSAESPDCRGLTTDEIGLVNFSKIDFSEFTDDVQSQIKDTNLNERIENAVKKVYQ